MTSEHELTCALPNGLHARPSSHLQEVTNRFRSEIVLTNRRNGKSANAKSVLALVCADLQQGDAFSLRFTGEDAPEAEKVVTAFIRDQLPGFDEPLTLVAAGKGARVIIPRALRAAGLGEHAQGTVLCRGIGRGNIVIIGGLRLPEHVLGQKTTDVRAEQLLVERAIATVAETASARISSSENLKERDVRKAHLAILRDVELISRIHALINDQFFTAGQAVIEAATHFAASLSGAPGNYLRERVLDIQDVSAEIIAALYGREANSQIPTLAGPSVCVAETLTPGQLLALDRQHVKGLVLGHAGSTSHTVILARSFGIPTLGGIPEGLVATRSGEPAVVDGVAGILVWKLSPGLERYYARAEQVAAKQRAALAVAAGQPARTADGKRLEVGANVASAEEAEAAFLWGAEGIGVFRTEMLFLGRASAPDEDHQFAAYAGAARAAGGKPVIIRSLDIGGDKPLPYLKLSAEANPYLGCRGVRLYDKCADLIRTQFRAILRASTHGDVRLMVPMISCVEEVRLAKRLLQDARDELRKTGWTGKESLPFGIMIEVPAAADDMASLAKEVDFFSIGTNDLTQYFFAADRDNAQVAEIYRADQPAFVRLLRRVVTEAHHAHKWVGVCGEMAENSRLLPLLIGLGVDEISVSPPRIGEMKAAIATADSTACAELAGWVSVGADRAAVTQLLDAYRPSPAKYPPVTTELVVGESYASSKAEVIRELADTLWLNGRTECPEGLEEEIWVREDQYSTGFGSGFAMPHCKSHYLNADSIVLLKCRNGVEWGSLDGQPVRVAILLAIREHQTGKEHLRILAQLSRLVMHDAFRERLLHEQNAEALCAFVKEQLGLADK